MRSLAICLLPMKYEKAEIPASGINDRVIMRVNSLPFKPLNTTKLDLLVNMLDGVAMVVTAAFTDTSTEVSTLNARTLGFHDLDGLQSSKKVSLFETFILDLEFH